MAATTETNLAGAAVDSQGRPVQDPTKNVLDLVEAGLKRQDDLREATADFLRREMDLRFAHASELMRKEGERIDAIRAVDVGNVAAAAAVSATQATTLAAQVATSAETLRNQVAAAATASTVALGAALDPIQKDIADLRRAQYEQQGQKAQVTESRSAAEDMKPLVDAIAALVAAQNKGEGAKQGGTDQRTLLAWGVSVILGLIAIGSFVFALGRTP
jgi:hypothetical protein